MGDAAKEICVDEVLTFYELQKWIQSEKINLEDFPIEPFDYVCNDKILFPIPGETADFLEKKNPKKTVFCVDGIEDCKSVLNSIRNNKFENTILITLLILKIFISVYNNIYQTIVIYEKIWRQVL